MSYTTLSMIALALVAIATVVYRIVEGWSWVDSLYFSVIAVTTIGFGDYTPTTDFTKLFTIAYVIAGVSLVASVFNERLRRHHAAIAWVAHRTEKRTHGTDRYDADDNRRES